MGRIAGALDGRRVRIDSTPLVRSGYSECGQQFRRYVYTHKQIHKRVHKRTCAHARLYFTNANKKLINCVTHTQNACYNAVINADNASIVNVNCIGTNNCENIALFVNYSDMTTILCNDTS